MEVLEHGYYYDENRVVKCNCGCKFKYEPNEIKTDYSLSYTTNPQLYQQYVLCPECNSRINLSKTFLHGTTQLS